MESSASHQFFSDIIQPEIDPHVDYESLFEQSMRELEGYHGILLNQQQLQQAYDNVWHSLRGLKIKWQLYQRYASLAVPVSAVFSTNRPLPVWDSYNLREKFQRMNAYLQRFPAACSAQEMLIKESMIFEWPNSLTAHDASDSDSVSSPVLVDRAPLLFISRKQNAKRVRRKYPSVQLCVLALNLNTAPAIIQCRARIITESINPAEMEKYGKWRPVGKVMKMKRDGEMSDHIFPYEEDNEALIANCGELPLSPLQFDKFGTLVVKFNEIGIDMTGRRAEHNLVRYRMEMYCRMRFANGAEIENTVLSNPFLIAANKEQNTTVLGNLAWEILMTPINRPISPHSQRVRWCDLRNFLRHSVQSQLPGARTLDDEELLHIQCMLFLPLAVGHEDLQQLEYYLFGPGSERNDIKKVGIKKIKYRLLRESVCDYVEIEAHHFLKEKCISMKDGETILDFSVWEWLSEAIEMIVDCDPAHLICEDLSPQTSTKKRKSSMMLKLFNEKLITMSSRNRVWKVYKSLYRFDQQRKRSTKAMLIHFCDGLAGQLTIHYSNIKSDQKPTFGNMSAVQLKSYEGGLVGWLMKTPYPSMFERLVRFDSERDVQRKGGKEGATFPTKKQVFTGFQSKTPKGAADPLQHDATFGPVELVTQPTSLPPFLLTVSNVPDRTPQDPHPKQSRTAGRAVTNTRINLSMDTKDATRIKHCIGIEHSLRFSNGINSYNPAL